MDIKDEKKNTLIKDGKKPISQKRKAVEAIAYDDVFSSALSLDPELMRELDERGLIPRFVDAKRMMEMGGYNDKGWEVYRRKSVVSSGTINPSDFKFGNDPSGIIRRGSLVLAVKTKEKADRHRKYLNQRAENQNEFSKKKADELRALARGIGAQVHEGYEENEAPGI